MVSATSAPSVMAPTNSVTSAIMHAERSVSDLAPTAVAKAFACQRSGGGGSVRCSSEGGSEEGRRRGVGR
jgi:hypothetical protein